ncbi:MAG: hypothetical protein AAGJ87_10395, partial [Pseudomonadota bacterium]
LLLLGVLFAGLGAGVGASWLMGQLRSGFVTAQKLEKSMGLPVIGAVSLNLSDAAQSLRSIRAQQTEQQTLSSEVAYTNSVCDSAISARIDWSTVAQWPEGVSLARACDGALSAVEAICRTQSGKTRVARIRSFTCRGDGGGPSLKGGDLSYGASADGGAFAETKAYLDGKL